MTRTDDLSPQAQALIAFLDMQGYICPWGKAWDDLWKLLPDRKRDGGGWKPAPPLILAGWYASGDLDKALRLHEHVRWADQHEAIKRVDKYLRRLESEKWHKWEVRPVPFRPSKKE